MYLFVPCDKKSHGTEISFPIRSNRLISNCAIYTINLNGVHPYQNNIPICLLLFILNSLS